MSAINKTITLYLQRQTCATICCTDKYGIPYCFSCYYVFNADNGLLYFKSSGDAHHAALLVNNAAVAGTILPDKLNKLIVRGVQLQGEVLDQFHPMAKDAFALYHKENAMALAIKGKVFTIRLDFLKMTDSRLGFGKKITWKRNEQEIIIEAK